MGLDQLMQRLQRRRAGADLVGQRRHAQIDAFAGVALALPVQRLVLAELLEQDHGQQVRAGEAPRRHMERRRRLRDLLAVPAGELLAHRLDHLPLARDHLQRLGDVLAQLRQPVDPQHGQLRRGTTTRSRGRCSGNGLRAGRLRSKEPPSASGRRFLRRQLVLGGGGLQVLELQLHLLEEPRLALRARAVE